MALRLGNLAPRRLLLGTVPVEKVFLGTLQVWAAEVVSVLGNSTNVVLKALFPAEQWADPYLRKRVRVPAGVEIAGTLLAAAIMVAPVADGQATSWAGELHLEIDGTVSGAGGLPDSGQGGDAIWANMRGRDGQKLQIKVAATGLRRGGGGGGGRAGNGGAGQAPYTFTEGPTWAAGYQWYYRSDTSGAATWGGVTVGYPEILQTSGVYSGGWEYFAGALISNSAPFYYFEIGRRQTRYNPTTGGIAGPGGRGQGVDGPALAGAPAAVGGTNAGASGKSGNGGAWGQPGQAGANGASGNVGGGLAGMPGGLAGCHLAGAANADLTDLGTALGRIT